MDKEITPREIEYLRALVQLAREKHNKEAEMTSEELYELDSKLCSLKMAREELAEGKPFIVFFNTKTLGDDVKALVRHYADREGWECVLQMAEQEVVRVHKKVKEFRETLLKKGDEE